MVRSLPPRVTNAPARVRSITSHNTKPGPPVRRYGQGRGGRPWRRRRARILARDGYLCQACKRLNLLTLASEVDHILPQFEGGTDDDDNLQALCETCHTEKTEAELQRANQGAAGTMTPAGMPTPMRPLWVIVGPPGSGKTTLVAERADPGDLVIDLDVIARERYQAELWELNQEQRAGLLMHRTELLRAFCAGETDHPQAWLIVGMPGERHRLYWTKLGGRVQVVSTPADVCKERIRARVHMPDDVRAELCDVVDRWE